MASTKLTVLSVDIPIWKVVTELLEHSIVVLETNRTHAKEIEAKVIDALRDENDPDERSNIIHLSVQVPDRGWSSLLLYTKKREYEPGLTQALVIKAVQQWVDTGSPACFVAIIKS